MGPSSGCTTRPMFMPMQGLAMATSRTKRSTALRQRGGAEGQLAAGLFGKAGHVQEKQRVWRRGGLHVGAHRLRCGTLGQG